MNAGHLVERLDFQRYRAENVFGSLISTRLDRLPLVSTQGFFSSTIFEIFSSILAYHIFVLLLVVVFFHYEIYCCQYHEPLCNIKKTNWSMTVHFYVWTASLICLSIIERITASVRAKLILSYSVTTILGVCALLITGGSYRTKHTS